MELENESKFDFAHRDDFSPARSTMLAWRVLAKARVAHRSLGRPGGGAYSARWSAHGSASGCGGAHLAHGLVWTEVGHQRLNDDEILMASTTSARHTYRIWLHGR
jgi:hypothetical protein